MEFNLEEMLNKVLEQLDSVAKTKTVIGEPFQLGDFTCVIEWDVEVHTHENGFPLDVEIADAEL